MPAVQVTRLNVDPGDHKAVTQKLRSLTDVTHVLYLGRASGSAADRDLAADLEGFRSLVAAARAAGVRPAGGAVHVCRGPDEGCDSQSCIVWASGPINPAVQQRDDSTCAELGLPMENTQMPPITHMRQCRTPSAAYSVGEVLGFG